MLGLLLGSIFLALGLYLTGSVIWRKLRCRRFVSASVALGSSQELVQENGGTKKNRFPQYCFTLNGRSYVVIDYNASRGCQLRAGDPVQLYVCDACPDRCWYPVGGLWKDTLWGLTSLIFAGLIGLLFLL